MGWYFEYGASRADVIRELMRERTNGTAKGVTLAKFASGNTLWTVEEVTTTDGPSHRYIGCYLLQRSSDGWGYKPMDESMGPCQQSCPPKFLDMVPCPGGYATAWCSTRRARRSRPSRGWRSRASPRPWPA